MQQSTDNHTLSKILNYIFANLSFILQPNCTTFHMRIQSAKKIYADITRRPDEYNYTQYIPI